MKRNLVESQLSRQEVTGLSEVGWEEILRHKPFGRRNPALRNPVASNATLVWNRA